MFSTTQDPSSHLLSRSSAAFKPCILWRSLAFALFLRGSCCRRFAPLSMSDRCPLHSISAMLLYLPYCQRGHATSRGQIGFPYLLSFGGWGCYLATLSVTQTIHRVDSNSQTLLSSRKRPHFQTYVDKWSWNEQKYGHESRRGQKPTITALAKASSKLLLCSDNELQRALKAMVVAKFEAQTIVLICEFEDAISCQCARLI
jgi:hypothetical protein